MPYKFEYDKVKLSREQDRRVKLTDEQRAEIRKLYGSVSQRKLAVLFGVSRRLIVWVACPEKLERNKVLRAIRGGSKVYYDKKYHKEKVNNTRVYKQKLALKGKLGSRL